MSNVCSQRTRREVGWITEGKWKVEPQVWHSVTCNQRRWQTFLSGCVRSLIGDCWVIFLNVHVSPRDALLALIIVLHYLWVPPPLRSWHAAGLADTPPLHAFNARPFATWMQRGSILNKSVSPLPSFSYLFLHQTLFYLNPWQPPHSYTALFYSIPVPV